MRKILFVNDEYYHVFNRGADKKVIFPNPGAFSRFLQSIEEFNTIEPIGSIYENSFRKNQKSSPGSPLGSFASKWTKRKEGILIELICYCLNPNHYHFVVKQVTDRGIEKFMHRLGTGFTKYFNQIHDHSGVLFQGPFKAIHIDSNEYLLHVSAYVNLNNRVHRLGSFASKSSWDEYIKGKRGLCNKNIIISQFKNIAEYKKFAEESVTVSQERKDIKSLLLE